MPQLLIQRGASVLGEYVFSDIDILTIGRAKSNDIFLPDPSRRVSRHHAAIVRQSAGADRYFIRDLGSLRLTRVLDQPIFHRVLREGDVIRIADYQLVYSAATPSQCEVSPLRVVSSKRDQGAIESSTLLLTQQGLLHVVSLTPEQQEVLESVLQAVARSPALEDLLQALMPAVTTVSRAARGFAGLFRHDGRFEPLGRIGLGARGQIEITDSNFADRLWSGRAVHEGRTVLAPIVERGGRTLGFFCLERPAAAEPFAEQDVDFLAALGRAVASPARAAAGRGRAGPDEGPLEWPVEIVGRGPLMDGLRREIREAAVSDMNALVVGESGTGKELVARAIHDGSPSRDGPFLARNCAAIPDSLAEAEMFGHAPRSGIAGADPGGAPGWFELAEGGTLFLDEIHGLSLGLQDKLLRVLQDKQVWRLRARSPHGVRVKVIAATDQDLETALERGSFRRPLYYRFGKRLSLPPLRDRAADVPLLAHCFLDRHAAKQGSAPRAFSYRVLKALLSYPWPGNVRELENFVRGAVEKAADREVVFSWDFPEEIRSAVVGSFRRSQAGTPSRTPPAPRSMKELEKEKIMEALEATHGNITRAQRLLGYRSRQTMLNKMDRYGIERGFGDVKAEVED